MYPDKQILTTCMSSCMPFQIECIVKSFSAKCTQVAFNVRMAFGVTIEQPLELKFLQKLSLVFPKRNNFTKDSCYFSARSANERIRLCGRSRRWIYVRRWATRFNQRVFNTVPTVYPFDVRRWIGRLKYETRLFGNDLGSLSAWSHLTTGNVGVSNVARGGSFLGMDCMRDTGGANLGMTLNEK